MGSLFGMDISLVQKKFAPLDLSRNKSKGKSCKNIKVLTI